MSARPVRAERLSASELADRIAREPLVFLPLGALEFHGPHLPIGLDALTAHALCVRAAERAGGVVLPPLFLGTGGEHTGYPWTAMIEPDGLAALVGAQLARLAGWGVTRAIVLSGHFSAEQLVVLDGIDEKWRGDPGMRVTATALSRCPGLPVAPDHAGVFESSLLAALDPGLVHLDRLSPSEPGTIDPDEDPFGVLRHDPTHPLWGVFGPDPRTAPEGAGPALVATLTEWLVAIAGDDGA